jgi:two-component sensor histidine kinase
MARVHDLLSKSERAQHIDVSMYVADLCGALRPITGDDDRIGLNADIDEGILVDADTAVPLGIVLTELITNAVKYAFPAPRTGTIRIRARRSQPGWVELTVRDDGVGMVSLREGSLGYGLVRSLVQQIRGEIDVRNDAGLVVTISFPEAAQQTV